MTMMQKMQAKKSKKGFTLVELVIVIAILAILAAIAIPVITTTINSSKLSTLESDCTTIDMMVKEAGNNYLANVKNASYNKVDVKTATVESVLVENALDAKLLDSRLIGGTSYWIGWTDKGACTVTSTGDTATGISGALTKDKTIAALFTPTAGAATTPTTP